MGDFQQGVKSCAVKSDPTISIFRAVISGTVSTRKRDKCNRSHAWRLAPPKAVNNVVSVGEVRAFPP
jgi:hypothetical protein